MWALRMCHENKYWEESCYLTLTYDDEHLPINGNLQKRDVQLFLKRIRKDIEPRKIKYFACGEYGEKFGRPHYHLIIFGLPATDTLFLKHWDKGFIKVANVGDKQFRYVCKYVTKAPLGKSRRDKEYAIRESEFQICSHGLGLSWLVERIETVRETGIFRNGRAQNVPRYYINKIKAAGLPAPVVDDAKADRMQKSKITQERWKQQGVKTSEDYEAMYRAVNNQRIEEVKTRNQLYANRDPDNQ